MEEEPQWRTWLWSKKETTYVCILQFFKFVSHELSNFVTLCTICDELYMADLRGAFGL